MVNFKVDPDKSFQNALNRVIKQLDDLTVPYKSMTREWYKGNKSIFDLGRKGPGKYVDLSEPYKTIKARYLGSPYPILVGFLKKPKTPAKRSGKLRNSMIKAGDSNAVAQIINKKTLLLGTRAKNKKGFLYPAALNFGTSKMPSRTFMLIGGEQVATPGVNKRRENWIKILNDYVLQLSGIIGDVE